MLILGFGGDTIFSMDYDYLSSIVSDYTNLSSLTNKTGSALGSVSSISDVINTLSKSNSFASVLDAAMQSAGVSDEIADDLQDLASVNTNNGFESEARSDLIMQNYLTAAIMKDTLQNSLTDSADFTSSLFDNLAVGTSSEDGSASGSMLGSLQKSTLSAISNMSSYQDFIDGNNSLRGMDSSNLASLRRSSSISRAGSRQDTSTDDVSDISEKNTGFRDLMADLSSMVYGSAGTNQTSSSTASAIAELAESFGLRGLSGLSNLENAV